MSFTWPKPWLERSHSDDMNFVIVISCIWKFAEKLFSKFCAFHHHLHCEQWLLSQKKNLHPARSWAFYFLFCQLCTLELCLKKFISVCQFGLPCHHSPSESTLFLISYASLLYACLTPPSCWHHPWVSFDDILLFVSLIIR